VRDEFRITRPGPVRLAIVSDIHHASPQEAARRKTMFDPISGPARRWFVQQYRARLWLRDPFAHNHLFDRFLDESRGVDYAIANGDYSCDSAYIGVSDDAAFASADLCLSRLRQQFNTNFQATFGDHEIGKKMLAAEQGGLRLASFHRAKRELKLETCWTVEVGRYLLIGVTSTLAALPLYEAEALPEERAEWRSLRDEHMEAIERLFDAVRSEQRILLFCHDPSALPFLGRLPSVVRRLPQLERTIIGHLHSPALVRLSAMMAGMPVINFLGHTPRRLSGAVREARHWKPFRVLLCPSLTGLQLLKDGGYYTVELDRDAAVAPRFQFHALKW
jgi:hypothetical protein